MVGTTKDWAEENNGKTRLEDFPEYVTELALLYDTRRQLSDVRGWISAATAAAGDERKVTHSIPEQARQFLASKTLPDESPLPESPSKRKLRRHEHILIEAERIQEAKVDSLVDRLSKEIAAALAPVHRDLVRAKLAAVIALSLAEAAEEDFREGPDGLSGRGVKYLAGIRPMTMGVARVGRLEDHNSAAAWFVREALEYGFVQAGEAVLEPYFSAIARRDKAEAASKGVIERGLKEFQAREAAKLAADVAETKRQRKANKRVLRPERSTFNHSTDPEYAA